jgi:hypothetical protein
VAQKQLAKDITELSEMKINDPEGEEEQLRLLIGTNYIMSKVALSMALR